MDVVVHQLNSQIVQAVAGLVPGPWLRIVVDFELLWDEDGADYNSIAFAVVDGTDGDVERRSISLDRESIRLFRELGNAMAQDNGFWGSCRLQLEKNGHYRFWYSYEPPKRINGVFDEDFTYLNDYLTHYRAEMATGEPGPEDLPTA
jgi:hypothetical protein